MQNNCEIVAYRFKINLWPKRSLIVHGGLSMLFDQMFQEGRNVAGSEDSCKSIFQRCYQVRYWRLKKNVAALEIECFNWIAVKWRAFNHL